MATTPYYTRRWRRLPRTRCEAAELLGGECAGPIHRHHVHPISLGGDPEGESVEVCSRHHPMLEALARKIHGLPEWKRCPHGPGAHRYPGAREDCERRLNRAA
ncbi:MAG TPA: hypothetical protein VLA89_12265 [Gemmatimonadales bacterium]|nr:hypothetical protein [Gemmatimonadales bacterium]